MSVPPTDVEVLLAERDIGRVLRSYTRAVDRWDWDLLRSCYWPDASDDHGPFKGGVEEFVGYLQRLLPRFERTMHVLGQMNIDVDLTRAVAAAETYTVAYHRIVNGPGDAADMIGGVRYVDRFERRGEQWRIARRVVAFDWHRTEPVAGPLGFAPGSVVGVRSRDDPSYHALD